MIEVPQNLETGVIGSSRDVQRLNQRFQIFQPVENWYPVDEDGDDEQHLDTRLELDHIGQIALNVILRGARNIPVKDALTAYGQGGYKVTEADFNDGERYAKRIHTPGNVDYLSSSSIVVVESARDIKVAAEHRGDLERLRLRMILPEALELTYDDITFKGDLDVVAEPETQNLRHSGRLSFVKFYPVDTPPLVQLPIDGASKGLYLMPQKHPLLTNSQAEFFMI